MSLNQGKDNIIGSDFLKNIDEKIDHTLKESGGNSQKTDNLLSDDFEHVEHDFLLGVPSSLLDHRDDFLHTTSQGVNNLKSNIDSNAFLKNIPKNLEENVDDEFEAFGKKFSDVTNLLDFERNDGVLPEKPKVTSNAEIDFLNSYGSKKNGDGTKDKFITSENLIEPFKPEMEPKFGVSDKHYSDILDDFDQGPSSINLMETEADIHDVKSILKDDEIKAKESVVKNMDKLFDIETDLMKPELKPEPIKNEPIKVFENKPEPVKIEPIKPESVHMESSTIETKPDIIKISPEPVKVVAEPIKSNVKTPTPEPIVNKQIKSTDVPAKESFKTTDEIISAEEMFCRIGLDAWFKPERLHPKVESLIYWRDPKKSGPVFGIGLALLIAMSCFSLISVFAYVSLVALAGTIVFRIYKNILQAVQKTSEGHPFQEYLEFDLSLSQEKVQQAATVSVAHVNAVVAELRRLFLVEDLIDSIKFGLILWSLTYVGGWFNGMTLVICAFVALFTLPKVYENNKQSIDTYLDLGRSKFSEITDKVKAAIPIGKKVESEKDK